MRRLVYLPRAQLDVRAQIEYLRERGEIDRIRGFDEDLTALEDLLVSFPHAGRELVGEGQKSLRRIGLRRSPLFVWYVYEPDRDEVTLVRVFHTKQRTPIPRPPP